MVSRAPTIRASLMQFAFLDWLILIAIVACISIIAIVAQEHLRTPTILTVDIEAVMKDRRETVRAELGAVPDDQLAILTRNWALDLDRLITQTAVDHRAVVLVSPAVVSGGTDITPFIIQQLRNRGTLHGQ